MSTDLAGLKIRTVRKEAGLTQGELARRAGISASYLNLIEQNKRPVAGALLQRVADGLGVGRDLLEGEPERRIVDELKEIAADPALADIAAGRGPAEEFVGRHPAWADLMLGIYRAYRQRSQDVLALVDRLNRDPFLGESVHRMLTKVASIRSAAEIVEGYDELAPADRERFLRIVASDSAELSHTAQSLLDFFERAETRVRAATPTEQVDAFLFEVRNYFPELEGFAEDCLRRSGADEIAGAAARRRPGMEGGGEASVRFRLLRAHAGEAAAEQVERILDRHMGGADAGARELAAIALRSYAAAAMLMPYASFFEAAERCRYDLDILSGEFGVSYEQAAHRLVTLRRPGSEGPRFAFMRSDASGFITKRLPLPHLPLPRYGNACPLWVVYGAFQSPGVTARAFGALPSGEEFLFFARAIEKSRQRAGQPRHLVSIMLACSALDAARVSAGDGIDRSSGTILVGSTCRLCPRAGCQHRQEAQLTA